MSLTRKQREDELLGMARGKLLKVFKKAGVKWKPGAGGYKGVTGRGEGGRGEAVRRLLQIEYFDEQSDRGAERREKRGRKRLLEALGADELREEIRELLWDLWEEGHKTVLQGLIESGAVKGSRAWNKAMRKILVRESGVGVSEGPGRDRVRELGVEGGGGGDQEVKKRIRRALRTRGWKGGLENPKAREVMGDMRPSVEIGMKKAWREIADLKRRREEVEGREKEIG